MRCGVGGSTTHVWPLTESIPDINPCGATPPMGIDEKCGATWHSAVTGF